MALTWSQVEDDLSAWSASYLQGSLHQLSPQSFWPETEVLFRLLTTFFCAWYFEYHALCPGWTRSVPQLKLPSCKMSLVHLAQPSPAELKLLSNTAMCSSVSTAFGGAGT
jgi:hypothetical protein